MSPSEELRAAASHIEELAAKATFGPWTRPLPTAVRAPLPEDERGWTRPDDDGRVIVVLAQAFEGTHDLLRERSGADLDWIAALGPQVCAPLVALLSSAAEAAECYRGLEDPLSHLSRMVASEERSSPAHRCTADLIRAGLDLARLVNGAAA